MKCKNFFFGAALLAVSLFSSCLEKTEDSAPVYGAYVTVLPTVGTYVLKDDDGTRYTLSTADQVALFDEMERALIYFNKLEGTTSGYVPIKIIQTPYKIETKDVFTLNDGVLNDSLKSEKPISVTNLSVIDDYITFVAQYPNLSGNKLGYYLDLTCFDNEPFVKNEVLELQLAHNTTDLKGQYSLDVIKSFRISEFDLQKGDTIKINYFNVDGLKKQVSVIYKK